MADKTNQEWIIENNLKIEEIKQLANTLPEYQDIKYNWETISSDVIYNQVYSSAINARQVVMFKNYIFTLLNNKIQSIDTITQDTAEISCDISGNIVIEAGCYNCFGTNTILVVVANESQFRFYLYDISNKVFLYKNTISDSECLWKYPALNPERPLLISGTNIGNNLNTTSGKVFLIDENFSLTLQTSIRLTTGNQTRTTYFYV